MRILDEITNKSLENIILYLTLSEAKELRDNLDDLIQRLLNNHAHLSSENYNKEITVCIYNIDNLEGFNERSINLILNDQ